MTVVVEVVDKEHGLQGWSSTVPWMWKLHRLLRGHLDPYHYAKSFITATRIMTLALLKTLGLWILIMSVCVCVCVFVCVCVHACMCTSGCVQRPCWAHIMTRNLQTSTIQQAGFHTTTHLCRFVDTKKKRKGIVWAVGTLPSQRLLDIPCPSG